MKGDVVVRPAMSSEQQGAFSTGNTDVHEAKFLLQLYGFEFGEVLGELLPVFAAVVGVCCDKSGHTRREFSSGEQYSSVPTEVSGELSGGFHPVGAAAGGWKFTLGEVRDGDTFPFQSFRPKDGDDLDAVAANGDGTGSETAFGFSSLLEVCK